MSYGPAVLASHNSILAVAGSVASKVCSHFLIPAAAPDNFAPICVILSFAYIRRKKVAL